MISACLFKHVLHALNNRLYSGAARKQRVGYDNPLRRCSCTHQQPFNRALNGIARKLGLTQFSNNRPMPPEVFSFIEEPGRPQIPSGEGCYEIINPCRRERHAGRAISSKRTRQDSNLVIGKRVNNLGDGFRTQRFGPQQSKAANTFADHFRQP